MVFKSLKLLPIILMLLALVACNSDSNIQGVVIAAAPTPAPTPTPDPYPFITLSKGQAATVAIGAPDLTTIGTNTPTTAADFNFWWGQGGVVIDGRLYFASAKRVTVFNSIPETSGASADEVWGQPDFTDSSASTPFGDLIGIAEYNGKFYLADYRCNSLNAAWDGCVSVWSTPPTGAHSYADADFIILGQSATGLQDVEGFYIGGGKMVVSSYQGAKVSVWNTIPTTADAAPDFEITAPFAGNGLAGLWTDGEKLLVCDNDGSRVFYWVTFPVDANDPPDYVFGQPDFVTQTIGYGANELRYPSYVTSNGKQVFIQDAASRVMVYNSFPTSNAPAADVVLGQIDFGLGMRNDADGDGVDDGAPSASTLWGDWAGLFIYQDKLLVGDMGNRRWLIFESQ